MAVNLIDFFEYIRLKLKMKKTVSLAIIILIAVMAQAQILNPVKFSSQLKTSGTAEAEIIFGHERGKR